MVFGPSLNYLNIEFTTCFFGEISDLEGRLLSIDAATTNCFTITNIANTIIGGISYVLNLFITFFCVIFCFPSSIYLSFINSIHYYSINCLYNLRFVVFKQIQHNLFHSQRYCYPYIWLFQMQLCQ